MRKKREIIIVVDVFCGGDAFFPVMFMRRGYVIRHAINDALRAIQIDLDITFDESSLSFAHFEFAFHV